MDVMNYPIDEDNVYIIRKWIALEYPKIIDYVNQYNGIIQFCISHGVNINDISMFNYNVECEFIIKNEYMHDMWLL